MKKKYALFGAGDYGAKAFKYYGEDHIECFIDNDSAKRGQELFGKKIISLEDYKEFGGNCIVVISCSYEKEISNQLKNAGITEYLYYSPLYERLVQNLGSQLKDCKVDEIFLFGLDRYTEQIIQALTFLGMRDRIRCIIVTSDSGSTIKTYLSWDVLCIDDTTLKADCYIVAAEKNNQALFLQMEQHYKSGLKINPFLSDGFIETDELVINPYQMENGDRSEEQWNYIVKNENDTIKAAIRAYVNVAEKNVPLFRFVEIETINRCNGTCSFCPVNKLVDPREEARMSKELFIKIIDQLAELNYSGHLALFSNNEPLLDERIVDFHKYAREKLPHTRMHLYTNGTLLTLSLFLELIQYLDELIIDNYRQDLKLIKPCEEIKAYVESHPELRRKVLIQLRKPKEIMTSRGGDAPNREQLVSYGDETCVLPFEQIIIRPDGKISLCCNDPLGKDTLGDLNEESILDIWYGSKFQMVRKCLSKGRKNWKHCEYCDTFYLR